MLTLLFSFFLKFPFRRSKNRKCAVFKNFKNYYCANWKTRILPLGVVIQQLYQRYAQLWSLIILICMHFLLLFRNSEKKNSYFTLPCPSIKQKLLFRISCMSWNFWIKNKRHALINKIDTQWLIFVIRFFMRFNIKSCKCIF